LRVSEKQLLIMFRALEGSLNIVGVDFGYDQATRIEIFKQIINQQSDKLIDVKDEEIT
jgi:hypothetical protein